jgi:hypothetical protein
VERRKIGSLNSHISEEVSIQKSAFPSRALATAWKKRPAVRPAH